MLAWVDASNVALGGILAELKPDPLKFVPVTMNNWLYTVAGAYRRARSCASLQADALARTSRPAVVIRDKFDLDSVSVEKIVFAHRNLRTYEMAMDSNEREFLAALMLFKNCGDLLTGKQVTVHFECLYYLQEG